MNVPDEGETHTFERTFGTEEVRTFAKLSGDKGTHHVEPDEQGRLLVHGLLTATLPTKVGGEDDVLASEMTFRFRRPVYTGQRLRCAVTYDSVDRRSDGDYAVAATTEVRRLADNEVVLRGSYEGVVRAESTRRRGGS